MARYRLDQIRSGGVEADFSEPMTFTQFERRDIVMAAVGSHFDAILAAERVECIEAEVAE